MVSLVHNDGYGMMGVEYNLKVLITFISSTLGIVIKVCRLYRASLRQAMGRGSMMV